jgi:uncharacterized protein YegP (UPF0339 family)
VSSTTHVPEDAFDTNGQIVATGAEGYRDRDDAVAGIRNVCSCCTNGEIEYV